METLLVELTPESFLLIAELVEAAAKRNNDARIKAAYLGVLRELRKALQDNS